MTYKYRRDSGPRSTNAGDVMSPRRRSSRLLTMLQRRVSPATVEDVAEEFLG